MDGQDWTPVVVKRRVAHAPRPASTPGSAAVRRLEDDDLPKPTRSLGAESRQLIIKKRVEYGWNQSQLNTQCAFPLNTIRDIEAGKLCPTPTQLNILNKVLKVVLKYD